MPAIYAHYSFGKRVFQKLPVSLKRIVSRYREEYCAGLQGPDFLFFYNPFKHNPYGELGDRFHDENASVFLERAVKLLNITGIDSPEGAYIMGFICHFMLDSSCHGLVEQMVREKGVSHAKQETELDRYMLELDGKDALEYPIYRLVNVTQELAETISVFYKGVSTYTVRVSQERMRLIRRILWCPGTWKRALLSGLMDILFGSKQGFSSYVIQTMPDPACREICRELAERLEQAVEVCAEEIRQFTEETMAGCKISQRMERNFNGD